MLRKVKSPNGPQLPALDSIFCSMKRLGVLQLSLNAMPVYITGYPPAFFSGFPNNTCPAAVYTAAGKLSGQKARHKGRDYTFRLRIHNYPHVLNFDWF